VQLSVRGCGSGARGIGKRGCDSTSFANYRGTLNYFYPSEPVVTGGYTTKIRRRDQPRGSISSSVKEARLRQNHWGRGMSPKPDIGLQGAPRLGHLQEKIFRSFPCKIGRREKWRAKLSKTAEARLGFDEGEMREKEIITNPKLES